MHASRESATVEKLIDVTLDYAEHLMECAVGTMVRHRDGDVRLAIAITGASVDDERLEEALRSLIASLQPRTTTTTTTKP